MSQKRYNILSIDFDRFLITDKDVLTYFPDGIDMPTPASELIWGNRYISRDVRDKILSVTIHQNAVNQIVRVLAAQDANTHVLVCNSHREIYDFIHEHTMFEQPLRIHHLDLHTDLYSTLPDIDCGNWLWHIRNEYPDTQTVWYPSALSWQIHGKNVRDSFDEIKLSMPARTQRFDLIFICRSDPWMPPHLDFIFQKMLDQLKEKAKFSIEIEEQVTHPRNTGGYNLILRYTKQMDPRLQELYEIYKKHPSQLPKKRQDTVMLYQKYNDCTRDEALLQTLSYLPTDQWDCL